MTEGGDGRRPARGQPARIGAWALAAATLVASAFLWQWISRGSEAALSRRWPQPASAVAADPSPAAVARGRTLALSAGCALCHGADLTGRALFVAGSPRQTPNLTRAVRRLSDAQFDRALRAGVRPDGTSELGMPSDAYAALTDQEVADLGGYLRSVPAKGEETRPSPPGLFLRAGLAFGRFRPSAERVRDGARPLDAGAAVDAGRRLAETRCGQCHGPDLSGGTGRPGPDLTVRGYFDRAGFRRLMRTGEGLTEGGNAELMTNAAETSLSHMSDGEIDAIFDYLEARDRVLASRPPSR